VCVCVCVFKLFIRSKILISFFFDHTFRKFVIPLHKNMNSAKNIFYIRHLVLTKRITYYMLNLLHAFAMIFS